MPEYMFTYMRRGALEVPIVRLKSKDREEVRWDIGKAKTIVIEQPDIIYEYNFVVKCPIKSEEDMEHNFYAWYQLENFSKSIDRSPAVKQAAEQNAANIDYLSMMSGIDLPDEEEENNEQEI